MVRRLRIAALPLIFSAPVASAADLFVTSNPQNIWLITLGDQLTYSPQYPGSRKYGIGAFPSFSARRFGEPEQFSAPDDSINFPLWTTDRFSFGPSGNVDMGRYLSQEPQLRGIPSIPWGPEAGGFAEFWPIIDRLRLKTEVRYGVGYRGIIADVGGDWVERFGQFTFAVGPRLELGNAGYMRRYFGVTPSQSAANGILPPYSLGAGLKSVGVEGEVAYRWNDEWKSTLFARYDRLVDQAAKSPIVTQLGTPDQFTVGVQLEYTFRTGY
jgi:outer membrane scaffolding protein for murein synthesis (MipA/OmpV family)